MARAGAQASGDTDRSGRPDRTARVDGRTARARVTRGRILDAATALFTGNGYTSTSVESIAARSGVGVQTVYYAYGSKRAILEAALKKARVGDDDVALLGQPWVQEMLACTGVHEQFRLLAEGFGRTHATTAGLLEVVRNAAATDPELAAAYHEDMDRQRDVHVEVLRSLRARRTPLRRDLDQDEAADIMLITLSPGSYTGLVTVRGWTHERWVHWSWVALVHQITGLAAP